MPKMEKQNYELLLRVKTNGRMIRTSCDQYCKMGNLIRVINRSGQFDILQCDPWDVHVIPWSIIQSASK